jgi:hypothetical protein
LHASPFVLTWNLYAGVPGLQGIDSGLRAHLGRGSEPTGGANISFPALLFGTLYLGIAKRAFGFTNGRVATCDSRGMLWRVKHLLISPHTADPSGWLLRSGSRGG